MSPLLRRGDKILLEAMTPEQLKSGDIITLLWPESLVTHRYWAKEGEPHAQFLLTRGDRPLVFDKPWPAEALIGRVNGRSRNGRTLSLTKGIGLRLNHHLAWIADLEFRWWGQPTGPRLIGARGIRRSIRGLLYAWATFITGICGLGA
ncbi:MAG: hypothetical protein KBE23_00325 [Chloroflexi bacterium]|nr:hypothetical protein [Chloroflexota bacterium]MBP7041158.1 hypothetical protein [Chloroflexota bacterium]